MRLWQLPGVVGAKGPVLRAGHAGRVSAVKRASDWQLGVHYGCRDSIRWAADTKKFDKLRIMVTDEPRSYDELVAWLADSKMFDDHDFTIELFWVDETSYKDGYADGFFEGAEHFWVLLSSFPSE